MEKASDCEARSRGADGDACRHTARGIGGGSDIPRLQSLLNIQMRVERRQC